MILFCLFLYNINSLIYGNELVLRCGRSGTLYFVPGSPCAGSTRLIYYLIITRSSDLRSEILEIDSKRSEAVSSRGQGLRYSTHKQAKKMTLLCCWTASIGRSTIRKFFILIVAFCVLRPLLMQSDLESVEKVPFSTFA